VGFRLSVGREPRGFAGSKFMNCPECGEVCSCQPERAAALTHNSVIVETDALAKATPELISRPNPETEPVESDGTNLDAVPPSGAVGAELTAGKDETSSGQNASAWRDELSARLSSYRSRRRMPPPRYPSLALRFEAPVPFRESPQETPSASFGPISEQALALDGTVSNDSVQTPETTRPAPITPPVSRSFSGHVRAKIIEFPKYFQEPFSYGPPSFPPDQLAEPVMDRPRILEVPEFAPPPPALGGITIEPAIRQEAEKLPGIDIPLQSASLTRRLIASLVDGIIITAASALFGFIFWKVAAFRPPQMQMLAMFVGISSAFWATYQYLLLVYSATTPGMLAAGLELARFDGSRTSRSLRRWRVLASYLSAASLGMGYAWVFLDEDVLCWHDRATRTYLAPRKRASAASNPR
jgi:uncharacterized RDD family membrane protein YckC